MACMSEDWFRSSDWSAGAQEDFERRLSRARPDSRPQYLRIKAIALLEAGQLESADALLERVIDESPDSTDARFGLELRGDIASRGGHLDRAADYYRRAIGDETALPNLSGTTGQVHVKLAETLFTLDAETYWPELTDHLHRAVEHLRFNADIFRWSVLNARVAQRVGDGVVARESALRALDAAKAGPQLSRHPTVGLVDAGPDTLAWLEELARS